MSRGVAFASVVTAITWATAVAGSSEAAGGRTAGTDVCGLLPRQEAAEILGVAIERVESKPNAAESTCDYFTAPVSQAARQQDIAKRFLDIARGGGPEPKAAEGDATGVVRGTGMGDLVKSIGAATRDPKGPYFSIAVHWTGGATGLARLKTTIGAQSPGVRTTEGLRGIGDDAMLGPLDTLLMFVKGDVGVTLGLANVPNAREKGIAMAKRIAGRI